MADVLLGFGWQLSGSDLDVSPVEALAAKGVRLFSGHAAAHLPADADELIYSNAVPAENPELRLARERGIAVSSYAEMLGRLGVGRRTLAVAGTHGKSTTTAMTAHVLVQAGLDPTVVCGATPLGAASGGRAGRGDSDARRGVRVPRQLPPPPAAIRRHPRHRDGPLRLLPLAGAA